MQRIDNSGAVASLPTPLAAGTPGYFGRGNPATGVKATPFSADFANMLQEELMAIVLAAGLTPSKTTYTQVRDAIAALYLGKAGGLMTGALGIVAGSASAPGMYFSGDSNTGIFSPGMDQLSKATAGVERWRVDGSGNVTSFIVGQSGLYPQFSERAWVNFTGSAANGAQTVKSGGNISSVSRTAAGAYTINFTTAMPDQNFGFAPGGSGVSAANSSSCIYETARTSSSISLVYLGTAAAAYDPANGHVLIVR